MCRFTDVRMTKITGLPVQTGYIMRYFLLDGAVFFDMLVQVVLHMLFR